MSIYEVPGDSIIITLNQNDVKGGTQTKAVGERLALGRRRGVGVSLAAGTTLDDHRKTRGGGGGDEGGGDEGGGDIGGGDERGGHGDEEMKEEETK